MRRTLAELQELRELARHQRERARRQREEQRQRFYDRANAFAIAFHHWQQLIGRQPRK